MKYQIDRRVDNRAVQKQLDDRAADGWELKNCGQEQDTMGRQFWFIWGYRDDRT